MKSLTIRRKNDGVRLALFRRARLRINTLQAQFLTSRNTILHYFPLQKPVTAIYVVLHAGLDIYLPPDDMY